MSRVSIAHCSEYTPHEVSTAVRRAIEPLGGLAAFVTPGDRVAIKVNLLSRAVPERAVTTHPEIVRALVRAVHEAGGVPFVADSPGGPNTPSQWKRVCEESGIAEVCSAEGVELILLDSDTVRIDNPSGELFKSFTIGRAIAEADVIINVPKLKTHGLMMLTGAVKNLFGCIPGLDKAQFHLKVPGRDEFGEMLVDLMLACRPALTIMDAIVGMEGQGPAGGKARRLGMVLASSDPAALDVVAATVIGLSPLEVYTNAAAARRGIGPGSMDAVDLIGDGLLMPEGTPFALPPRDTARLLPPWLGRRVSRWVNERPVRSKSVRCTNCGLCVKTCPVAAVRVDAAGPVFDRDACISCYCCQEMCPPQAIDLATPAAARWISRRRTQPR